MLDKERYNNRPFSNMVRKMVLQMCKPEPPSFEEVVVHFPVSDRTFQRKLKDEGLSFRKITNEVKSELSTYLSMGNKMKTQEIAHILGYSEPSAYLHAVKRWDT
jgi:AraC-like DNA-binding protein